MTATTRFAEVFSIDLINHRAVIILDGVYVPAWVLSNVLPHLEVGGTCTAIQDGRRLVIVGALPAPEPPVPLYARMLMGVVMVLPSGSVYPTAVDSVGTTWNRVASSSIDQGVAGWGVLYEYVGTPKAVPGGAWSYYFGATPVTPIAKSQEGVYPLNGPRGVDTGSAGTGGSLSATPVGAARSFSQTYSAVSDVSLVAGFALSNNHTAATSNLLPLSTLGASGAYGTGGTVFLSEVSAGFTPTLGVLYVAGPPPGQFVGPKFQLNYQGWKYPA